MTDENQQAAPAAEGEAAPKIKAMRRQPCPCGSGKVFKNCHEGDPRYEVATDASQAVHVAPTAPKGGAKPGFQGMQNTRVQSTGPARNTGNNHRRKV